MRVSLERELKLHGDDEVILVPKEEEPPDDAEQPHAEIPVVGSPLLESLLEMGGNTHGKLTN